MGMKMNKNVDNSTDSNVSVYGNAYVKNNKEDKTENVKPNNVSYAKIVDNGINSAFINNKLIQKPTEFNENRNEIVNFDDELIKDGSLKWNIIVCGYFVGHSVSTNELRYNLRRMWNGHGFKDVRDSTNGIFFIKPHHDVGINYVVDNGPWMVKGIPLVV
ncbi:zinc knuckle CX2CX4HX4C containing protein [Tanacetum coccineum]